ncbi:Uncharacterised protein [Mycobacteroides abscessus subsp. abscessus]|nr:Uncharacterised protein [Mycobacteroides abscessus subsp. abscessus]
MMVSDANKMLSAISLGVFWREAPSTSAIIRSTNDSPGAAVICTTMRSESTVVPPVTAQRSPPDSRTTGADSPVMADSSTVAMPSTTSPSPGIICPASTTTRSPGRSALPGTSSSFSLPPPSPTSLRATVSRLTSRRLAACALPRPSATASARFANTTVNHSHAVMAHANIDGCSTASTVVATDPTVTTNITGLRAMCRGSSLRTASGSALINWAGSKTPVVTTAFLLLDTRGLPRRSVPAPAPGRR